MSATSLHNPVPAAEMLTQGQNLRRIDLIRQCANEARESEFERKWLSLLERCARWFSSMPLNAELYREPGGAFRFTVETAFYAMRLAGGQKFGTTLSSEQRRRIEPQYNYAVFLAAVCSGLDEPYRHFEIVRDRDQSEWNPSAHGGADAWLDGAPYLVRRRNPSLPVERMRTGLLAQMLIGQELLADLDAVVLAEMLGAINPSARPEGVESLIQKVVRHAIEVAADFDRKAQRQVFAPVAFAVPSAVHVAAAVQPAPAQAATAPGTSAAGSRAAPASSGTPSAPGAAAAAAVPAPASKAAPPAAPVPSAVSPAAAAPGPIDTVAGATPAGTAAASRTSLPEEDAADSENQTHRSSAAPVTTVTESLPADRDEAGGTNVAASATGGRIDQLGLPFLSDDPAKLAASRPSSINPADVPTGARERQADTPDIAEVLKDVPNMIREFFRLLREDVASGKAAVKWDDTGLVVSKRLVGSYGVASDTLVEHLRRRSLLVTNGNGEITFAPRAGELILARAA